MKKGYVRSGSTCTNDDNRVALEQAIFREGCVQHEINKL